MEVVQDKTNDMTSVDGNENPENQEQATDVILKKNPFERLLNVTTSGYC